jgi:hypothetical protein
MKFLISMLLCVSPVIAQTVYEIPFASAANEIELSVANRSSIIADGIKVEAANAPAWIKFESSEIYLSKLNASEEKSAVFKFSVDKTAEVNKELTLKFAITDKSGQMWKKEIGIKILPPSSYELYQNYPNPFNPATVISYQLPALSNARLKIYDAIGREVVDLVNERQEAGYHEIKFNAQNLASGMYVCQLVAVDDKNKQHIFKKKMILLR